MSVNTVPQGYEAYNRALAETIDAEFIDLVNLFTASVVDYNTINPKFVSTVESGLHIDYPLFNVDALRKKLLVHYPKIIAAKGSIYSYELFFRLLGFKVDIGITTGSRSVKAGEHYVVTGKGDGYVEFGGNTYPVGRVITITSDATISILTAFNAVLDRMTVVEGNSLNSSTFDSGTGFDSSLRTFDSDVEDLGGYYVELYGEVSPSNTLVVDSYKIVKFLEPINARLLGIKYNGVDVPRAIMRVYIDEEGDIIYDNSADPTVYFELTDSGDLVVKGPNAYLYYLDSEGNLFKTQ
jgi:hypothetical protein